MAHTAETEEASRKRAKTDKRSLRDDKTDDGADDSRACNSCRRRKTRCSRQSPCSQCTRLRIDCVYDEFRERSGVKPGTIQMLSQRVSNLEQMLLGQGLLLEPLLQKATGQNVTTHPSLHDQAEALKQKYTSAARSLFPSKPPPGTGEERCATTVQNGWQVSSTLSDLSNRSQGLLPPKDRLHSMVDVYFAQVHPWIPILHEQSFRQKLDGGTPASQLVPILLAITSLCLRLDDYTSMLESERCAWSLECRNTVILQGMDKFSVENLQALVIIAFDIIGTGRGPSAWSIVGSMTRTVEQLQLSVEDGEGVGDRSRNEFLIRRMKFLRQPKSWTEIEERRRVFWSVFLMDRFCSVATGWNNSLTSDDVHCRLPCEGAIWAAGSPVKTPRFGIAGRAGVSAEATALTGERQAGGDAELDAIGGFAFNVEASENLNLVTRFFLQHPVRFDDKEQSEMWYVRFKELDLRLVKWRLYLPAKWRNASAVNQDGIMDPNLTLAHMTHNTAVIQLHQAVAYPEPRNLKMASQSSAEVCLSAASEITTIAQQFLAQSTAIANPQFSFCLFIAGRVLLSHASFYPIDFHAPVDTIVELLEDIARRWAGRTIHSGESTENLASRFGKRLHDAKNHLADQDKRRTDSATLDIRRPVYSEQGEGECETRPPSPEHQNQKVEQTSARQPQYAPELDFYSPDSVSMAFPPLPSAFQQYEFVSQPELTQDMHQNGAPEQFQIDATYDISSQISPVLTSQNLNNFDFGRFHDLTNGINQQTTRVSTF